MTKRFYNSLIILSKTHFNSHRIQKTNDKITNIYHALILEKNIIKRHELFNLIIFKKNCIIYICFDWNCIEEQNHTIIFICKSAIKISINIWNKKNETHLFWPNIDKERKKCERLKAFRQLILYNIESYCKWKIINRSFILMGNSLYVLKVFHI